MANKETKITVRVSYETSIEAELSEDELNDLRNGCNPFEGEMTAELENLIEKGQYEDYELSASLSDGGEICHFIEKNDEDGAEEYLDDIDGNEDIEDYLFYLAGFADKEELEDFLGYKITHDTCDFMGDRIVDAYYQMPKEEFNRLFENFLKRREAGQLNE